MRIKVKVKPGSKKDEIKKIHGDFYEVRVVAVPEKGKANKRVIELLAKHFKTAKSRVKLIKGKNSKEKIFEIDTDRV